MVDEDTAGRWARVRFLVIGKLLMEPPTRGTLRPTLKALAAKTWPHPTTGEQTAFAFSTIERWYYQAKQKDDPVAALTRQIRCDAGVEHVLTGQLLEELRLQYREHPSWIYQLHADNLVALVKEKPKLGPCPSYSTVRRGMKKRGWRKSKKAKTPGQKRAQERLEKREVRSYEMSHAHALWHFDGHQAHRKVVDSNGIWFKPVCICVLDDYSRLSCHAQWYETESAKTVHHTLVQAFLKRRLPRGGLCDNGGAMTAAEIINGFAGLGINHDTTLDYSAYQNGKQESFWTQVEGRLMSMLESVEPLTLEFLNEATQAWLEQEYNRSTHSEIGMSPLERMLEGPDVSRPSRPLGELRFYFSVIENRRQRRSDGTISVSGVRFEVPSRYRHLEKLTVRYARWDLRQAYLVDPRNHAKILTRVFPLDKQRNADGRRRVLDPVPPVNSEEPREPLPPLMRQLLEDYAATGLPPAYLPLASIPLEE